MNTQGKYKSRHSTFKENYTSKVCKSDTSRHARFGFRTRQYQAICKN